MPLLFFQLLTGGVISTGEEPTLVYDKPKVTVMQRYSLLKARFMEDARLKCLKRGSDDDTNARRRAAEHRGKQLLAFRDTVEVIG